MVEVNVAALCRRNVLKSTISDQGGIPVMTCPVVTSRDAEPKPEPEPEPPELTHFGRSRSRSRLNGLLGAGVGAVKSSGFENECNCGKTTENAMINNF